MPLSFKTRLSLWHTVTVAVLLVIAALGSNWAFSRLVRGQVDDALRALADAEIAAIEADPARGLRVHEPPPGTTPPSFVRLDKFVQIIDGQGTVLARSATLGTAHLPRSPAALDRVARGAVVFETVEDFGEEPIRLVTAPLSTAGRRYAVQVATSLDDARALLHAARSLFLLVAVAILVAVVATGALLARRALRPIDRIVRQARRIGESNLSERLPHPGSSDEIGRLVATLNEMLARLERSFEAQRRFTADASHELRSPLSRLRAELEVTLRRRRDSAEYEEALRSCLEEVERLSQLSEELLALARLDAGQAPTPPGPIAIMPIVDEAVNRLTPEARRRQITMLLEPSPALFVRVAPGAASVAIANVLDNAVKFSPPGGHVTVKVITEGSDAVIAVTDTGPGLLPDEMPQVFERFHRGSASRAEDVPGIGLGLAISRALVEGQGGRISVDSKPGGGATFTVRLPLAA